MNPEEINFCPRCGEQIAQAERFGRLRKVCPACGWVFFHDPKVAVATVVEKDGLILFVRRAIDPRRGFWTLPAGFVDAGEDPREAAVRECLEETGLTIRITGLLDVFSGQAHPNGAHIIIFYHAEVVAGRLHPGDDVDRAAFFPRNEPPPLAFSSTSRVLNLITAS